MITLSRKETLKEVKLVGLAASVAVDLEPASFSFLKVLAKSFSEYRWSKLEITWVPSISKMQGGNIGIGIDPGMKVTSATSMDKITALTKNYVGPLHQPYTFKVDVKSAQTRKWYLAAASEVTDKCPLRIHSYSTTPNTELKDSVVGTLMACYTLELRGTYA